MGWQDAVDSFGDAVSSGIKSAVEAAGELIDSGLDVVADGARTAGVDGVGDFFDDLGDRVVDATGGELTERELGQTRDPKELLRGEPSAIDAAVQTLVSIGGSIESTGDALEHDRHGRMGGRRGLGVASRLPTTTPAGIQRAPSFRGAPTTREWHCGKVRKEADRASS